MVRPPSRGRDRADERNTHSGHLLALGRYCTRSRTTRGAFFRSRRASAFSGACVTAPRRARECRRAWLVELSSGFCRPGTLLRMMSKRCSSRASSPRRTTRKARKRLPTTQTTRNGGACQTGWRESHDVRQARRRAGVRLSRARAQGRWERAIPARRRAKHVLLMVEKPLSPPKQYSESFNFGLSVALRGEQTRAQVRMVSGFSARRSGPVLALLVPGQDRAGPRAGQASRISGTKKNAAARANSRPPKWVVVRNQRGRPNARNGENGSILARKLWRVGPELYMKNTKQPRYRIPRQGLLPGTKRQKPATLG